MAGGNGLDKVNRTGIHLTWKEKRQTFADGFGRGTQVARELAQQS